MGRIISIVLVFGLLAGCASTRDGRIVPGPDSHEDSVMVMTMAELQHRLATYNVNVSRPKTRAHDNYYPIEVSGAIDAQGGFAYSPPIDTTRWCIRVDLGEFVEFAIRWNDDKIGAPQYGSWLQMVVDQGDIVEASALPHIPITIMILNLDEIDLYALRMNIETNQVELFSLNLELVVCP